MKEDGFRFSVRDDTSIRDDDQITFLQKIFSARDDTVRIIGNAGEGGDTPGGDDEEEPITPQVNVSVATSNTNFPNYDGSKPSVEMFCSNLEFNDAGSITGELNYITDYTEYEEGSESPYYEQCQSGHYLPIKVECIGDAQVTYSMSVSRLEANETFPDLDDKTAIWPYTVGHLNSLEEIIFVPSNTVTFKVLVKDTTNKQYIYNKDFNVADLVLAQ